MAMKVCMHLTRMKINSHVCKINKTILVALAFVYAHWNTLHLFIFFLACNHQMEKINWHGDFAAKKLLRMFIHALWSREIQNSHKIIKEPKKKLTKTKLLWSLVAVISIRPMNTHAPCSAIYSRRLYVYACFKFDQRRLCREKKFNYIINNIDCIK